MVLNIHFYLIQLWSSLFILPLALSFLFLAHRSTVDFAPNSELFIRASNATSENNTPSETSPEMPNSSPSNTMSILDGNDRDQQIKLLSAMIDRSKNNENIDERECESFFNLDNAIDTMSKIIANMNTGTPASSDEDEPDDEKLAGVSLSINFYLSPFL